MPVGLDHGPVVRRLTGPLWGLLYLRRLRLDVLALLLTLAALLLFARRRQSTTVPFSELPLPYWVVLSMVAVTCATPYLATTPTVVEAGTPRCDLRFLAVPHLVASAAALAVGSVLTGTGLVPYYAAWTLVMLAVANLWASAMGSLAWCPVFLTWVAIFGALSVEAVDVHLNPAGWWPAIAGGWLASSALLLAARRRRLIRGCRS